jgi:hypothetical protein
MADLALRSLVAGSWSAQTMKPEASTVTSTHGRVVFVGEYAPGDCEDRDARWCRDGEEEVGAWREVDIGGTRMTHDGDAN